MGGVGKTSALIPLVVHLSGKTVSMLTNNLSQQANLKKAFPGIEMALIEEFDAKLEEEVRRLGSGEDEHLIIVDEATNISAETLAK
jgi:hypothetical protein